MSRATSSIDAQSFVRLSTSGLRDIVTGAIVYGGMTGTAILHNIVTLDECWFYFNSDHEFISLRPDEAVPERGRQKAVRLSDQSQIRVEFKLGESIEN
jgi:hypothetical protein